jgi:hypothetical protein
LAGGTSGFLGGATGTFFSGIASFLGSSGTSKIICNLCLEKVKKIDAYSTQSSTKIF